MIQQQVNVGSDYQLVTFNAPRHLLDVFDDLRKYKNINRTSTLLNLMESFVRTETKQLREDDKLKNFIRDVKLRSKNPSIPSFNKKQSQNYVRWEDSYNDTPPSPIFNDDEINDGWRREW